MIRSLGHYCIVLMFVCNILLQTSLSAAETFPVLSPPQQISLDYTDADLPEVLKSIAYSYDLNLVIADNIKGKVSAQLKNISLDEALDAILRVNGYGFSRRENIVYILQQSELDLETQYVPLSYLLAKTAKELISKGLSKRGDIQIQEATNSLIITDLSENVKKVMEMVKGIDQQPMQVLIEAKILDINSTDAQTIGTEVNATYSPTSGELTSGLLNTGEATARGVGGALKLVPNFKYLTDTNVTISALVQQQKARVLAAPSIATLNGLEARIMIGDRIPYNDSSTAITPGAGGTTTTSSIQYVDVGTSLKVTPLVSPDGWITMKIHPEVSKVTKYSADGVPLIGTREADATIRVRDNETIIIGGLISNDDTSSEDGVPGLRSIPFLGWFFKKHVASKVKSELMVFITPHIIRSPIQGGEPVKIDAKPVVKVEMGSEAMPEGKVVPPVVVSKPEPKKEELSEPNNENKDMGLMLGLLSYADSLEKDALKKDADNIYIKLELIKTYKLILEQFPMSGKAELCLYRIASIYVKDFAKCDAAQDALLLLKKNFSGSLYIETAEKLVNECGQAPAHTNKDALAVEPKK